MRGEEEAEEKLCQLPPAGLGLVKRAQIKENCKGLWASRLYFLSLWCFVGASGGREGSLEREKEIRLSFSSTLEVKKALCCCCYSLMLQVSSFFLCLRHATKKIIRQSSRGASELHFTWEREMMHFRKLCISSTFLMDQTFFLCSTRLVLSCQIGFRWGRSFFPVICHQIESLWTTSGRKSCRIYDLEIISSLSEAALKVCKLSFVSCSLCFPRD